jgi:hypothetical protein
VNYASDRSLGVFDLDNAAESAALVRRIERTSGRHEIILRKFKARRSAAQNRYWWGVVIPVLAECWQCSHQDAHDRVTLEFVGQAREIGGKALTVPGSTSALSTSQFNQLVQSVQQYAAFEYGKNIPDPNEWPDE